MMATKLGYVGLGALLGAVAIGGVGFYVVQLMIPWEAICATVAPSQRIVETGGALIADMRAWLDAAEAALSTGDPAEAEQAKSGLGGLLDRAKEQAVETGGSLLDVATAPLRALIDLAQVVLAAVSEAVDAATAALDAIDSTRC